MSSYITKSFWVVGSKDTCVVHLFLDMSTLISVFNTFFSGTNQRSPHVMDGWSGMLMYEPSAPRCALQICHTSTFPTVPVAILNLASATKVSHVRLFVDVFPGFPAFVKQVEMWGICSFIQHFVAPQYAQTNLKQAQWIKVGSIWAAPVTPAVFPSLVWSLKPFMQNYHFTIFFTSQGKHTSL